MGRGVAPCSSIKGFARLGDEFGDSCPHVFLVGPPVSGFHPQVKEGTPHTGTDLESADHARNIDPETLGPRVMP